MSGIRKVDLETARVGLRHLHSVHKLGIRDIVAENISHSKASSLKDYGGPSPRDMEGADNISLTRTAAGMAAGTASGAAIGAVIGSVIPIVGTAIGAWTGGFIGNAIGSVAGALSTPSKKDGKKS